MPHLNILALMVSNKSATFAYKQNPNFAQNKTKMGSVSKSTYYIPLMTL